jgi:hypothetical protein
MLPRWCVPLRAGRDLLGYLWVLDADETVTEAQLPEIVASAELAAGALASQRVTEEQREHRRAGLLARLAFGPDDDAAAELIRLENLDPSIMVTVQAPPQPGGWELAEGLSVHTTGGKPATSGPSVPLAQVYLAVQRARVTMRALRAGAVLKQPTWDSLGAWHLIVAAPDDLTAADVHPGAEVLATEHRSDLLVTARTLLDHGGDVAGTAAELHIHRTTLYYRIERIEALTGVNLKSGADRDDLQMALRLAAYRDAAD